MAKRWLYSIEGRHMEETPFTIRYESDEEASEYMCCNVESGFDMSSKGPNYDMSLRGLTIGGIPLVAEYYSIIRGEDLRNMKAGEVFHKEFISTDVCDNVLLLYLFGNSDTIQKLPDVKFYFDSKYSKHGPNIAKCACVYNYLRRRGNLDIFKDKESFPQALRRCLRESIYKQLLEVQR